MKKIFLSLTIISLAMGMGFAQKGLGNAGKKIRQGISEATRGATHASPVPRSSRISRSVAAQVAKTAKIRGVDKPTTKENNRVTKTPTQTPNLTPHKIVTASAPLGKMQAPTMQGIVHPGTEPLASPEEMARLQQMEDEIQAAQREGLELRFHADFGKSVLLASSLEDPYLGFSVTVFKININGKEEIFGVIPSHSLPRAGHLPEGIIDMHGKDFSVLIKQADGRDSFLPAQLIQVSPESMLDISLVKFSPEVEPLLHPLELAPENASLHDFLLSYGYAAGNETQVGRTVNFVSFLSLRTNQTIEGDRQGFCGSPWLDAQNRVRAIHTGSVVGVEGKEDASFGTHARFVRLLVDAYLNEGNSSYDLVLDGHHLATLNIDEYISDLTLFDATGRTLMQHHFDAKFSQSVVLNALKQYPNAHTIELTSRKAIWENNELVENRSNLDPTKRQHWYNLQTRQIEPERPDGIKM